MYSQKEINAILDKLLAMTHEIEVVEFKRAENSFSESDLGKYFSALSNEANLKGMKCAWLVMGVDNDTHQLTNTQFKPSRVSLDALKKKIADQVTARLTFDEIYDFKRRLPVLLSSCWASQRAKHLYRRLWLKSSGF